MINDEHQYYVRDIDLEEEEGLENPISINAAGNLEIRAYRTPQFFEDKALGIIDGFTVTGVDTNARSFVVEGANYYDLRLDRLAETMKNGTTRTTFNINEGRSMLGANHYLRDNVGNDPALAEGTIFAKKRFPYGFVRFDNANHRYVDIDDSERLSGGNFEGRSAPVVITMAEGEPLPSVGSNVLLLRRLPFVSGMLSTRGEYNQKFGSWHVRLKVPGGRGSFAAAWCWPDYSKEQDRDKELGLEKKDKDIEIDFVEQLGHTDIQYHNAHHPGFDMLNYVQEQDGMQPIFTRENRIGGNLPSSPTASTRSGLRGSGGGNSDGSLFGPEWDAKYIQQHQVILREKQDQIDFANTWQEVIWDWYEDNTCAWFVKVGNTGDDGEDFREAAHMHMAPLANDGTIDSRVVFLNNAVDSKFNREQEWFDRRRTPFDTEPREEYVLEVDFVRGYLWGDDTGSSGGNGGQGSGGAVAITIDSFGPTVSGSVSGVAGGRQLLLTPTGGSSVTVAVDSSGDFSADLSGNGEFSAGVSVSAYINNADGEEDVREFIFSDNGSAGGTNVSIAIDETGPIVSGAVAGVSSGRQLLLTPANGSTVTVAVGSDGGFSIDLSGNDEFFDGVSVSAYINNADGAEDIREFVFVAGVSIMIDRQGPVISGSVAGVSAGRQILLTPTNGSSVSVPVDGDGRFSLDPSGNSEFANGVRISAYINNADGEEDVKEFVYQG